MRTESKITWKYPYLKLFISICFFLSILNTITHFCNCGKHLCVYSSLPAEDRYSFPLCHSLCHTAAISSSGSPLLRAGLSAEDDVGGGGLEVSDLTGIWRRRRRREGSTPRLSAKMRMITLPWQLHKGFLLLFFKDLSEGLLSFGSSELTVFVNGSELAFL